MAAATAHDPATPAAPEGEGTDRPPPPPPPRRAGTRVGELISAVSALALLVLLFATQWYGVAGMPNPTHARPAVSRTEDGWNGLTDVRWVLLVTILAAVGTVALHVSQRRHGVKTDTSRLVTGLGALSSLLLVYRVLIALPGGGRVIDQKLGAVLGLVCALGILWGGAESINERRAAPPPHGHRIPRPGGRGTEGS